MYLRITVTTEEFEAWGVRGAFPHATHVERLDHAGVVNVYAPCHEFGWERDGEWWLKFEAGDAQTRAPEWDEWGLVSAIPEGADAL